MRTIYHGSQNVIKKPEFSKGNPYNDYGLGFYCTESIELAKEWACIDTTGGYTNIYTINTEKINVLNLSDNEYSILNWLSILVENRTFRTSSTVATQAKEYLLTNFLPDLKEYDAIIGYRADDSYFSFAMDFLSNTISLRQLERAMFLGKLGEQIMIKSKTAFEFLQFKGAVPVEGEIYYAKRMSRDNEARVQYLQVERRSASLKEDIFMIDILRQEMKQDDARLQRNLFK